MPQIRLHEAASYRSDQASRYRPGQLVPRLDPDWSGPSSGMGDWERGPGYLGSLRHLPAIAVYAHLMWRTAGCLLHRLPTCVVSPILSPFISY